MTGRVGAPRDPATGHFPCGQDCYRAGCKGMQPCACFGRASAHWARVRATIKPFVFRPAPAGVFRELTASEEADVSRFRALRAKAAADHARALAAFNAIPEDQRR